VPSEFEAVNHELDSHPKIGVPAGASSGDGRARRTLLTIVWFVYRRSLRRPSGADRDVVPLTLRDHSCPRQQI